MEENERLRSIIKTIGENYPLRSRIKESSQPLDADMLQFLKQELHDSHYKSRDAIGYLSSCTIKHDFTLKNVRVIAVTKVPLCQGVLLRLHKTIRRIVCLQKMYNGPPLTIYFIPWEEPKRFPADRSSALSPPHINSAFTYPSSHTIIVYRQEEFPKVMLHEVLHNLPHNTENWTPTQLKSLYSSFHISTQGCSKDMSRCHTDLAPNEAIIETWAEIYHLCFLYFENPMLQEKELMFHILEIEKAWSIIQAKRILEWGPGWIEQQGRAKWKENTHAYSYTVIRAAILFKPKRLFVLGEPPYSSSSVSSMIIEAVNDPDFQEVINKDLPIDIWSLGDTLRFTISGNL